MRIGVAGLNGLYWPISIADGLLARPGVQFVAAATLGVEVGTIRETLGLSPQDYAAKYGVRLYDRADAMVAGEHLDAVAVVTPHSQHADWVERLAPLGVDLYLPKTFATSAEAADRIVAAERASGIRVAVGPSARFLPQLAAVRQALDRGLIGEPFALRICHHHGTIDGFSKADWYRDAGEGGPELSLGWYGIDLALHLMNDKVKAVAALYGNFTTPGSPFMDCGLITMRMERGGLASFDMYFCNRFDYPAWQLEMTGPKGVISIHRVEGNAAAMAVSLDGPAGCEALPVPTDTPHWERFWIDELAAGRPLSLTADYARTVTLISLAARDSARTGQVTPVGGADV
jgi:predicted dehydrogenase